MGIRLRVDSRGVYEEQVSGNSGIDGTVAGLVIGIAVETMAGLPSGRTLTGALVGMTVLAVIGTTNTGVFANQASEFESTITVAGQIQQTGGPSNNGTCLVILSK